MSHPDLIEPDQFPFHDRLRASRAASGLSQTELANRINIHPDIIGYLEDGKYSPSLLTLMYLAKVLRVSTDYLLGLVPEPSGRSEPVDGTASARDQIIPRMEWREERKKIAVALLEQARAAQAWEEKLCSAGIHFEDLPGLLDYDLVMDLCGLPEDNTASFAYEDLEPGPGYPEDAFCRDYWGEMLFKGGVSADAVIEQIMQDAESKAWEKWCPDEPA